MVETLPVLARRVESHAEELRARASRLCVAAAQPRWQSLAAEQFRREVEDVARHMRAVALRVDAAATAVRRHAAGIALVEAELQRVQRIVGWLERR